MTTVRESALKRRLLGTMVRMLRNTPQDRLPSVPALMLFASTWGNVGYGGTVRLLRHICRIMRKRPGKAVLECGSGASTVLLGILAERYDCRVVSLEHHEVWAKHMQAIVRRFGLNRVRVLHAPLESYGDFSWYAFPESLRAMQFGTVVCDGPPAATRGGRSGLLPVTESVLSPDCVVVLDDTHREGERKAIESWKRLRDIETQSFFALKGYTEIRFV